MRLWHPLYPVAEGSGERKEMGKRLTTLIIRSVLIGVNDKPVKLFIYAYF